MRKLVLSLCVVAASGAYVAATAATREGGLQALVDRLLLKATPPPSLDIDSGSAALADQLTGLPPTVLAPPAADVVVASAPTLVPPSDVPAEPAPAVVAILPPLPRLEPSLPVVAALEPAAVPIEPPPGKFHDGDYTGGQADAYFGMVQVRAHIVGGKLASVDVLHSPASRRTSVRINDYALPVLEHEVVAAQDAVVDIVSGATLTARAYMRSLDSALGQAL